MTFKTTLLAGTVLGLATIASGAAFAQTAPAPATTQATVEALNRQIQALQGQLKSLEEKLNKEIKAVDSKVSKMPTVSADGGRPRIRTADKAFDVAVRGRFHLDYGVWFPDNATNVANNGDLTDGFNVRRAYIGVAGTVFTDWGYELTANFAPRGGSSELQAANVTYKGVKDWEFIVGIFQPKFTLDDSTSSNDIAFIERASLNNILVGIGGADARSGLGAAYSAGNLFVAAYLTGERTSTSTAGVDDQKNLLGRVAYTVYDEAQTTVGVGASAVYQFEPSAPAAAATGYRFDDRPGIRIGVDTSRFTRAENITNVDTVYAYGADVAVSHRAFWAAAEYAMFGADTKSTSNYRDPEFDAWYVSAGYVLTGERRKLGKGQWAGVKPAWPLGANGTGAWEVAARYSVANLEDEGTRRSGTLGATSLAGEETVWTLGLNWYPNSAIRFMLNYLIIENDRPGTRTTLESDAVAARVQFQF